MQYTPDMQIVGIILGIILVVTALGVLTSSTLLKLFGVVIVAILGGGTSFYYALFLRIHY